MAVGGDTLVGAANVITAGTTASETSPSWCGDGGGKERQEQNYPIALLAVNARLLQGVIYEVLHENLLSINLSYLMLDLKRLNEALTFQAEEIIRKFLQAEKRTA